MITSHSAAHLKLTAIEELRDGGGRIAPESAGAADTNRPPHRLHQPAFKIKGTVSRDGFGGFLMTCIVSSRPK